MKNAIHRFLTLDARNIIPEVYFGLLFIYAALLFTTINSIYSQDISSPRKILWILFVIVTPIAGMAIYTLRCLLTAEHSFLQSIGLLRSNNTGNFKAN
jgi:hypothetical protein